MIDVFVGGFTILVADNIDFKVDSSLLLLASSINPNRHLLLHPLVDPSILFAKVALS